MDVPYIEELLQVRETLESYFPPEIPLIFPYPRGKCQYASRVVKEIVGLEEIAGKYMGHRGEIWNDWHAWNYDPERKLYVDLSMDQFSHIDEKVILLLPDTLLLKKSEKQTQRQREFRERVFLKYVKEIIEQHKSPKTARNS